MLSFQVFLPLKEPFMATLYETRALTFRKHEAKEIINVQNFSEILKVFCLHSTVFALQK